MRVGAGVGVASAFDGFGAFRGRDFRAVTMLDGFWVMASKHRYAWPGGCTWSRRKFGQNCRITTTTASIISSADG
jgi:hypothetical protein